LLCIEEVLRAFLCVVAEGEAHARQASHMLSVGMADMPYSTVRKSQCGGGGVGCGPLVAWIRAFIIALKEARLARAAQAVEQAFLCKPAVVDDAVGHDGVVMIEETGQCRARGPGDIVPEHAWPVAVDEFPHLRE
jgi:hypothetical protein